MEVGEAGDGDRLGSRVLMTRDVIGWRIERLVAECGRLGAGVV